jgi:hypothetical protein
VRRHAAHRLDDSVADSIGGMASGREVQQDREPAGALDQGADRRAGQLADDQVAFPVSRHGPVVGFGRSLVDHRHVDQSAAAFLAAAMGLAATAPGPQRLRQLAMPRADHCLPG